MTVTVLALPVVVYPVVEDVYCVRVVVVVVTTVL